jgi:hypothetical protein
MQDLPEKETILLAIAKFLGTEVRPQVTDPRLSFRLLIAAHLCGVVASECFGEDEQDAAELARLHALLEGVPADVHGKERVAAIRQANARLAKAIRAGEIASEPGGDAWEHVKKTLFEKLSVANPRFETKPEIS